MASFIQYVHRLSSRAQGFPGDPVAKTACQCRRHRRCGFDPWVGKIPGKGNGNPLQCSCLENPRDRGAWWAAVHGFAEPEMTKQLRESEQSNTCSVAQPFPPPGDLPDQGSNPSLPHLPPWKADSLPLAPPGNPEQ